jgi:hypothetical protein
MPDNKTGYLQWRMSYQDSEQAARAAYAQMMLHFLRVIELEQQINARETKNR